MTETLENKPPNILIMDDEPNNLNVLRQMLSKEGYKVRPVINSTLALQAVSYLVPDLILLDIMMADGMNGYEVCEELKTNNRTKKIPVIFLSALDDIENKIKAFKAGGVDYITKPFNQEEVIARVKTHVTLHHYSRELFDKNNRLEVLNKKLKKAFDEIKTLRGILPICANCKKIRDDNGYWNQIETYVKAHTCADFSHGICPDCIKKLYPHLDIDV